MAREPDPTGAAEAAGPAEPAGAAGHAEPAEPGGPAEPTEPERTAPAGAGEPGGPSSFAARFLRELWTANTVTVTVLAIFLALVVGAILIVVSDPVVRSTYGYFFARPGDALTASWEKISSAYANLFKGSVLDPAEVRGAIDGSNSWARVFRPISETLTSATPLAFTGLAFALAFRGGLFNIGVQGQAILGAIGAGLAGFLLPLPVVIHLVVALLAGALFGAAWGFVPGFLKARTGAHEVVVTIMLNWVALSLLAYLIIREGIQAPDRTDAISKPVAGPARLPRVLDWLGSGLRVNLGIVLAVVTVAAVAWLLKRATFGFELRAVGMNPHAARAAGMSITTTYVLVMVVAGGLAGLGGAAMVLGPALALTPAVIGTVGFDGILVGLLGRAKPWGVLAAALLFGALQAGGRTMQTFSNISLELSQVLQALIVIFVAAPALVKATFALREARAARAGGIAATARGW